MSTGTKSFIALSVEFPFLALVLFLSAGTFAWVQGWVFLGIMFAGSVLTIRWLLAHGPGVIEERMGFFKPRQKAWDKVFVVLITAYFLGWLIVMPLDAVRFGWSHMPLWLEAVGTLLLLYSFYLFFLVYRENPFLSSTVRVQEERGQTVITTGPYRFVRHPMYSASIALFFGTSLLLGSWCGVLLSLVFVPLIAARAFLEERQLRAQLQGYDAYLSRVRYRLIPHIW